MGLLGLQVTWNSQRNPALSLLKTREGMCYYPPFYCGGVEQDQEPVLQKSSSPLGKKLQVPGRSWLSSETARRPDSFPAGVLCRRQWQWPCCWTKNSRSPQRTRLLERQRVSENSSRLASLVGAVRFFQKAHANLWVESCFRALLSPPAPRQAQTRLSWKEVRPPPHGGRALLPVVGLCALWIPSCQSPWRQGSGMLTLQIVLLGFSHN